MSWKDWFERRCGCTQPGARSCLVDRYPDIPIPRDAVCNCSCHGFHRDGDNEYDDEEPDDDRR